MQMVLKHFLFAFFKFNMSQFIFTERTKSCVQSWTHKGQKLVRMLSIAYKYDLDIIYYKYNIIYGTTSEPFNDRSTFAFV